MLPEKVQWNKGRRSGQFAGEKREKACLSQNPRSGLSSIKRGGDMKSHSLVDGSELASEAKWEKHVLVALWIVIVLLIAVASALVYAEAHGLFDSSPDPTRSVPPWPAGWP